MGKFKVGLVGIGRGTAYGHIFANNPKTEVTALCDINEESLAASGKSFELHDNQLFSSYDDFINADFDIAVIGTPIPDHTEQVIKALESKKHVLCEVTAANTIEGCQQIVDAVKKSDRKYMLAENCNYMHFVMQWKKMVDEGKIGKIVYAEAEYVHEIRGRVLDSSTNEKKWRAERAPIHYCSHSLGPILHLMDDYIVRGTCMGKDVNIIPNVGVGAIDYQVALFETSKGAVIKVLRSSVLSRKPPLCHYELYGTKGFIENGYDSYDNEGRTYFEGEDETSKPQVWTSSDPDAPEAARLGGHGTSEFYIVRDFIESIENDTTPPIDIVKAMDMTVPGIIAHEAAMKGNVWLDVPRLGL
ncbi:MAG TPA: Gfo/Idh/MocA family oxidoreductase [Clostridiales bacterium]|nr:Gfo/Idh/MocA family oxidoreductase [Clostridiales bacterium]